MSSRLEIIHDPAQWDFIKELKDKFPNFQAVAMGYVGRAGKNMLKKSFLSGQDLDLQAYPRDKKGRRTVSYTIGKRAASVRISSYPVNLFEHGRKLRDGTKQSGKKIITGKLKGAMSSGLQSILNDYDSQYLQKELSKI